VPRPPKNNNMDIMSLFIQNFLFVQKYGSKKYLSLKRITI
jgi:hypothetical protein